MATHDIVLPRLGEAVIEATLTKWLKAEGDFVNEEDPVAEIATDKVDTEITAPVSGILKKKMVEEGTVVPVGQVLAILETTSAASESALPVESAARPSPVEKGTPSPAEAQPTIALQPEPAVCEAGEEIETLVAEEPDEETGEAPGARFYSPLVRNIARQENIPFEELGTIRGTGKNDRLTKQDLLAYIDQRKTAPAKPPAAPAKTQGLPVTAGDQVIEMDRIRQLIATHLVKSVQTSPHVTSFIEADMTAIVRWREKHKAAFRQREGVNITYTPVIIEAIAKAIRDIPMMNVSVDGTRILVHKRIHVGMAVALPNANLIVPVIKDTDQKSLLGITREVNDLAERARMGKLVPDEISGGTISLTNLGSFGTLAGTPIINQPQAAIVAVGSIKKRPVVIETPDGDAIGIRSMMILSVTFDHRVIDGALAGQFLNRLVEHLEQFNTNQTL